MSRRRLVTIMAIDTVDYSRLIERDGRGLLRALTTIVRRIVQPAVERGAGRIFKLAGDAALAEFPSAGDAIEAAVAIQDALSGDPPVYQFGEKIRVRIGLHAGDVLDADGDLFGEAVNIAARLETAADPGGILVSRLVADLAGTSHKASFRSEGVRSFKNIARPIETLSVDRDPAGARSDPSSRKPETPVHFCRAKDGTTLAWTSAGQGSPVVKAPNWIGHLELDWTNPLIGPVINAIAAEHRLIRFDTRANGLSEGAIETIDFDTIVDDLEAVFDASGIERAPILAISQGAAIAAAFAARAPGRVSAIVMIGPYALGRAVRPGERARQRAEAMRAMMASGWDDEPPSLRDLMAEILVPLASIDERRAFAEDMRQMITPEALARYRSVVDHIDVTGLLKDVTAPCLVLHCRGDRMQPVEEGRRMAAGLPNARFIACDSPNHVFTWNDPAWPEARREILSFLNEHG